jgi:hypothetical protein
LVADIWGGFIDRTVATRHDFERMVGDEDHDLPRRVDAP